jgi:hypothetical protein
MATKKKAEEKKAEHRPIPRWTPWEPVCPYADYAGTVFAGEFGLTYGKFEECPDCHLAEECSTKFPRPAPRRPIAVMADKKTQTPAEYDYSKYMPKSPNSPRVSAHASFDMLWIMVKGIADSVARIDGKGITFIESLTLPELKAIVELLEAIKGIQ